MDASAIEPDAWPSLSPSAPARSVHRRLLLCSNRSRRRGRWLVARRRSACPRPRSGPMDVSAAAHGDTVQSQRCDVRHRRRVANDRARCPAVGGTRVSYTPSVRFADTSPVGDGGGSCASRGRGQGMNSGPYHKPVQATTQSTERASQLRRDSTPPERLLWTHLRSNQMLGLRFRRQHPLGPYIADFYCARIGLVVEVDGSSHEGDRRAHDRVRDRWMCQRRLTVIRFRVSDVMSDIEGVLRTIERDARRLVEQESAIPPPSASRTPPPSATGEET